MFPLLFLFLAFPGEDVPKGKLVLIGGGATTTEIVKATLDLAGGKEARVLVVPQASAYKDAGAGSVEMWREAGAKTVAQLDLADAKAAVRAIESADLIWMPGGAQDRLVAALDKAGVSAAIRKRYREGAVVGGTSAGAAAASTVMITGDAELDRISVGTTKTATGLGLWPEVIVDQHFGQRGRFNRLLAAVLDRPTLVGVGLDESTAVIVRGRQIEVIGKGNAVVIDAREARVGKGKSGAPADAANVKLHVLKAGAKYHLDLGFTPK